jgi:tetratricopeptide (TPR) repeat protein
MTTPLSFGRFVVTSELGAGAMGTVYAADDPQLGRTVAVKVLRPGLGATATPRLLREAQALASVAHPNVVAIHDVGVADDRVFIAMEHVDGVTLDVALAGRDWRAVLAAFVQAGRGLAAVHARGLVHRDFKPANVLVDREGRVRVGDLGLARREPTVVTTAASTTTAGGDRLATTADAGAHPDHGCDRAGDAASLGSLFTAPHARVGTPRYMAPEQHRGDDATRAADQFAFCIALWETLFGEHPFVGDTAAPAIGAASPQRRPARRGRAPRWLEPIVVRGLATAPAARWPSMNALLDRLERAPRQRRLVAAAVIVAVLVAGALVIARRRGPVGMCTGARAALVGVWDTGLRHRMERAFLATERAHAGDTFRRVASGLDQRADAWAAMHTDACLAARVRGEQSTLVLDRRMACLGRRRAEMKALVAVLAASPDPSVLDRATAALGELGTVDACADPRALAAREVPPRDAAQARDVDDLERRLDHVDALVLAGQHRTALPLALAIADDADRAGYGPIRARARARLARTQRQLALHADAERNGTLAMTIASEVGVPSLLARALLDHADTMVTDDARDREMRIALRAARALAVSVGDDLLAARADLAELEAVPAAERGAAADAATSTLATLHRLVGPDHPLVLRLTSQIGLALVAAGRLAEGRRYAEEALAIVERAYGPDHPDMGGALVHLGTIARLEGRLADARDLARRAVVIAERAYGPDHPDVARAQLNLGIAHAQLGELDEAERWLRRALARIEAVFGPTHALTGRALGNLAALSQQAGRLDEAAALETRALAIKAAATPDHPSVAISLENLGEISHLQRHYVDARRYFERALAVRERAQGKAHPDYGAALALVARELAASRRCDAALPMIATARAIVAASGGSDTVAMVPALMAQARCDLARRPAAARTSLEHAIRIHEALHGLPHERGEARAWLARALWAVGDRDQARTVAARAEGELATGIDRLAHDELLHWRRSIGR